MFQYVLKPLQSELSTAQQEANELRTHLEVEKEDCSKVAQKSLEEFQNLEKEKQLLENQLRGELSMLTLSCVGFV